MAQFEFRLPDIGEGVTEGEIVSWLVKVGDMVAEGQDMVEVMTDKATVTIGAPRAGRVAELRGAVGEVMAVGSVLVVLSLDGADPAPARPAVAAPDSGTHQADAAVAASGASAVGDLRETLPGMAEAAALPAPSGGLPEKPLAAPATRKYARELGIDLRAVRGSGPAGRITQEDVERHARAETMVAQPAQPLTAPLAVPVSEAGDQRQPIRGVRKRIFENMARSKRTAAHFTYVDECDASALIALRERTIVHAKRAGVKLTFLPFIVKAVVAALKRHPELNCWVDDAAQEMVVKSTYDIGIATATDAGLIVPVLRQADRRSILDCAREIERLASSARDGKTLKEDLGGSTFTVTSLGKLGGLFATPVINYPEVGILGVHEIKRRPVVSGDEIVIGNVMLLSLSFDHRLVDGHVGAAFARTIIELLEDPDRLLVEL